MRSRILGAGLLAVATLGLGACSSYDRYGYSGVSVGVNYGSPYYGSRYGRGDYYGWYGDYYYPGTGYYIYDRRGTRHRWSNRYRDYWMARRSQGRSYRDNWSGYNVRRDYRDQRPAYRDRDWYRRNDYRQRDDRRYDNDRRDRHEDRQHDRRDRDRKDRRKRRSRDD